MATAHQDSCKLISFVFLRIQKFRAPDPRPHYATHLPTIPRVPRRLPLGRRDGLQSVRFASSAARSLRFALASRPPRVGVDSGTAQGRVLFLVDSFAFSPTVPFLAFVLCVWTLFISLVNCTPMTGSCWLSHKLTSKLLLMWFTHGTIVDGLPSAPAQPSQPLVFEPIRSYPTCLVRTQWLLSTDI